MSAILDLSDKSIVSFVLGHSNNNALVYDFDIAHKECSDTKHFSIVIVDINTHPKSFENTGRCRNDTKRVKSIQMY
jgi:hypothetical protein